MIESDSLFKAADAILVIAAFMGGVAAVYIQRFMDRRDGKRGRQHRLFEELMATRATRLSPRHIEALNFIPVIFSEKNGSHKRVREDWNQYLEHLNDEKKRVVSFAAWEGELNVKLANLIHTISETLGYNFPKSEIQNGIYHPQGLVNREVSQLEILSGLTKVFDPSGAIKIILTGSSGASDQKPQ